MRVEASPCPEPLLGSDVRLSDDRGQDGGLRVPDGDQGRDVPADRGRDVRRGVERVGDPHRLRWLAWNAITANVTPERVNPSITSFASGPTTCCPYLIRATGR